MTYYELWLDAVEKLDHDEITLGEYDKLIMPLHREVDTLDKIRTEIEGYKSTIDNAISEDELKIEGMKEAYTDALDIIDKYRDKVDEDSN